MPRLKSVLLILLCLQINSSASAASDFDYSSSIKEWNQPYPAFKILDQVYFVGTASLAVYLIDTGKGLILLDTAMNESFPLVKANIESLGFKLSEIKIMLSGHAHFDHVGGHAAMQQASGAEVHASKEDAKILESGGKAGFHPIKPYYPPTKVHKRFDDGASISLGNITMTAILTPGHTEGNTAWTMTTKDRGRDVKVVFASSMSVNPGVKLVANKRWSQVAGAYQESFARLKRINADVFLGPHTAFFDMDEKRKKLQQAVNPFIDPAGFRVFIGENELVFQKLLSAQKS
jgi:metallo-beta-lactamase class B